MMDEGLIKTSVDLRGGFQLASIPTEKIDIQTPPLKPEAPVPEDCTALSPTSDQIEAWNADLNSLREGRKGEAGVGPEVKVEPRQDGSIVMRSPGSCYHMKPGGRG